MACLAAVLFLALIGPGASVHAQVTEKPGSRNLSEIKLMQDDPAGVEAQSEDIKARYSKIFRV